MIETPQVKVGQVWADNDNRSKGRTLRVKRIYADTGHAACVVLTDSAFIFPRSRSTVGKTVRIALKRFRPTSTGYRLVAESYDENA